MNSAFDRWRDRLGLALVAAMASLPFLHPRHFNPIPSFWAEWWAVALGLGAAGMLLIRSAAWQPMRLPRVMLLPLVFCAAAVIQVALRQVTFVEQALLYTAMLLWAALMMMLGRHVRERFGLERVVDLLAATLLAGALANAIIAMLQWQGGTAFDVPWIFPREPGHPPYGNIGQGNHLNHHMWLGVVSAIYLHFRGRVSFRLLWAALAPLLLAATLTASRSVFLYTALLPLLAWPWARLGNEPPDWRRWLKLTLPVLPAVILLQWVVKNTQGWLDWLGAVPTTGQGLLLGTASDRLYQEVSGGNIRLRLLAAAWREFIEAPWLGSGIGSFPWKLFLSNEHVPADMAPGVAEHAHNIVFHWLAEFGLIPTLLALAILALWARRYFTGRWQLPQLWLAGVLGIAAIHSLLEYPLWYGYFLGLAALLLGMSDDANLEIHNGRRGAMLSGAVIIGAMAPLITLRMDYGVLEDALNRRPSTTTVRGDIDKLLQVQRNSLLAPHVLVTLAVTMDPSPQQLEAKVAVCESAQRFAPSEHIAFKCALLLQLAGRQADAAMQMRRALLAFPEERKQIAMELRQLASRDTRLAPLAAMAATAASGN